MHRDSMRHAGTSSRKSLESLRTMSGVIVSLRVFGTRGRVERRQSGVYITPIRRIIVVAWSAQRTKHIQVVSGNGRKGRRQEQPTC
jgi:hypothetical protein